MKRLNRDYAAGELIAGLREDRGYSRRDLCVQTRLQHPRDARMHVSERTLIRVEEGAVPTARIKFAIAQALDLLPSQVWGAGARRAVHA